MLQESGVARYDRFVAAGLQRIAKQEQRVARLETINADPVLITTACDLLDLLRAAQHQVEKGRDRACKELPIRHAAFFAELGRVQSPPLAATQPDRRAPMPVPDTSIAVAANAPPTPSMQQSYFRDPFPYAIVALGGTVIALLTFAIFSLPQR